MKRQFAKYCKFPANTLIACRQDCFGQMLRNEWVHPHVLNELMVQCQPNNLVLTNQKAAFNIYTGSKLLLCCVCLMNFTIVVCLSLLILSHSCSASDSSICERCNATLNSDALSAERRRRRGEREGKDHAHTTMAVHSV